MEQYKRAFARQRARDLAQHADTLLSKDKEIAALQQECRDLEERLGVTKVLIALFVSNRIYLVDTNLCLLIRTKFNPLFIFNIFLFNSL